MEFEDFGKRLKEVRKGKGLTQDNVAELLNTAPSYLSDIERGVKTPSLNTFVQLLIVLEVSADYILQGSVDSGKEYTYTDINNKLDRLTPKQRQFVAKFIDLYVDSLKK